MFEFFLLNEITNFKLDDPFKEALSLLPLDKIIKKIK